MSISQLALPLQLQDHAVFDSFYATGNDALFAHLVGLGDSGHDPGSFIWGKPATGKTHLLQAICERVGDLSVYLPLRYAKAAGAGVLQGLAERRFICLDDLDSVTGDEEWEFALFDLLNQIADNGAVLVVSASSPPRESGIRLADLESRLSRVPVFQIRELEETDRIKALQLRAHHRGLELPDDTATYLLNRSRRDMASLYELLDRLDTESLIAKRRLTIPFVRQVLGQ